LETQSPNPASVSSNYTGWKSLADLHSVAMFPHLRVLLTAPPLQSHVMWWLSIRTSAWAHKTWWSPPPPS